MIEFLNSIQNSLIYKNFFLVQSGLDNTILLLLISKLVTLETGLVLKSTDKNATRSLPM